MSKKRYTAKQVIDALQEAKGYVSKAAGILQCDPRTVYNYRDEYSTVADAWDAIREARHDSVESALAGRISAGDTTAIIFYLKTQCKRRGYSERNEIVLDVRQLPEMSDDEIRRMAVRVGISDTA